jgi:hypothetical protein
MKHSDNLKSSFSSCSPSSCYVIPFWKCQKWTLRMGWCLLLFLSLIFFFHLLLDKVITEMVKCRVERRRKIVSEKSRKQIWCAPHTIFTSGSSLTELETDTRVHNWGGDTVFRRLHLGEKLCLILSYRNFSCHVTRKFNSKWEHLSFYK